MSHPSYRSFASTLLLAIWFAQMLPVSLHAEESYPPERKGLFKRMFSRTEKVDRTSDTISRVIKPKVETGPAAERSNDPIERYPHLTGYNTLEDASQQDIDDLIDAIYASYEARIERMDPPDLKAKVLANLRLVPSDVDTSWKNTVRSSIWGQRTTRHTLDDIYIRTLTYSNQIKVFSDIPLIRETGIQEADGEFDFTTFIDGRTIRRDEPVGSSLTTGRAGRFLENEDYLEAGVRKKLVTGAEASVSNRITTLDNNSQFLTPQFQGSSELVLSVVQPILKGGGYHYNQSSVKIAKLDAKLASAEFVRQLQNHLLEVNRAYWAVYFARSNYLIKKQLVDDTAGILGKLEDRSDLDALESEVLRARASLAQRKSLLNGAELAVRNNEERLRSLVNDPDFDIGSSAETIPLTRPVYSRYMNGLNSVAKEALHNRPEIQQAFDSLRAAVIRRNVQRNEVKPQLNLIAELMLGDIEPNERTGAAFDDQFREGPGHVFGFSFEAPWDNDVERARLLRREYELRQQANQLKTSVDTVLLEALTAYRELMTAYRDMQGRFETLLATREELTRLNDRLEVDTDEDSGRTFSSQLQLILDSTERNQSAEEAFLNSVVLYNSSFANLERAKGTFLRYEDIQINRDKDTDATHPYREFETLNVTKASAPNSLPGTKATLTHHDYADAVESDSTYTFDENEAQQPSAPAPSYTPEPEPASNVAMSEMPSAGEEESAVEITREMMSQAREPSASAMKLAPKKKSFFSSLSKQTKPQPSKVAPAPSPATASTPPAGTPSVAIADTPPAAPSRPEVSRTSIPQEPVAPVAIAVPKHSASAKPLASSSSSSSSAKPSGSVAVAKKSAPRVTTPAPAAAAVSTAKPSASATPKASASAVPKSSASATPSSASARSNSSSGAVAVASSNQPASE